MTGHPHRPTKITSSGTGNTYIINFFGTNETAKMHPKHFAPYQSASDFPSKKRKRFEKALKEIELDRKEYEKRRKTEEENSPEKLKQTENASVNPLMVLNDSMASLEMNGWDDEIEENQDLSREPDVDKLASRVQEVRQVTDEDEDRDKDGEDGETDKDEDRGKDGEDGETDGDEDGDGDVGRDQDGVKGGDEDRDKDGEDGETDGDEVDMWVEIRMG